MLASWSFALQLSPGSANNEVRMSIWRVVLFNHAHRLNNATF